MDLQYLLNILLRRKWLILLAMLTAIVATYIFVDMQKDTYKSNAIMSTGIIDYKGVNMNRDNNPFIQKVLIETSQNNLINFIQSRTSIRFLSYHLLLNDLRANLDGTYDPYTVLDEEKIDEEDRLDYTFEEYQELVNIMDVKLDSLKGTIEDPKLSLMFKKVAKAYGYDDEALRKNLVVEKMGDTDLLSIEYTSNDPKLSYFAVKNFCTTFLSYYELLQGEEDNTKLSLINDQTSKKKAIFERKLAELNGYRQNKNLVDLTAQRQSIVRQIKELESERQDARRKIPSLKGQLQRLDGYLAENENESQANAENTTRSVLTNTAIINLKARLSSLQEDLIASTSRKEKKKIQSNIDLTKKELEYQIERLGDEYGEIEDKQDQKDADRDIRTTKRDLKSKRIQVELDLSLAEESVTSVEAELERLRNRASSLVSDDAFIRNLEQEIEVAKGEYLMANQQLEKVRSVAIGTITPLEIIEEPQVAEKPEPSNKALLSIFAGIVSASLCVVLIFLLSFLDTSLNSPFQFSKFTNVNLLGSLNEVNKKNFDLNRLFANNDGTKKEETFKELLRNLRHTLESSGSKTFLFTSTKEDEGKTFLIVALAYSLVMKNKKILLIDTNFKNNSLTQMSKRGMADNLLHTKLLGENSLDDNFVSQSMNTYFDVDEVDIIGNRGTTNSPSEIFADKNFNKFIEDLEQTYDYIFLESAPMNKYTDTKELTDFVDKVIAVFSADSKIGSADQSSLNYLRSLGNKFMGGILNKVDLKNMN